MNVALLGFGTVGQAVARLLLDSSAPLTLSHIFNRQIDRKRVDWIPGSVVWTERFEDVLSPAVDLVIEVVGGLDPAGTWHRRAIAAGTILVIIPTLVIFLFLQRYIYRGLTSGATK